MEYGTELSHDVVRLFVESNLPNDVINMSIAIGMKFNISHAAEPHKKNSCKSVKNGTLTIPFNQSQYVLNINLQLNYFSRCETLMLRFIEPISLIYFCADALNFSYLAISGKDPSASKSLDSFCAVTYHSNLNLTCNVDQSGTGVQLIMNSTIDPPLTVCNLTINTFPGNK
jgi:hypothetical protein